MADVTEHYVNNEEQDSSDDEYVTAMEDYQDDIVLNESSKVRPHEDLLSNEHKVIVPDEEHVLPPSNLFKVQFKVS